MNIFTEREQAFEFGFAHDEEVRFEILARRNALLGQWAADRLGYSGAVAGQYVQRLTDALCEPAGGAVSADDRVISKLAMDLEIAGWELTRDDLRKILAEFEGQARTAVMEGPKA